MLDSVRQPRVDREPAARSKSRVFVVHGHDEDGKLEVSNLLHRVGLDPIVLHEQTSGGMTVAEKLERYSDVGFAVILMSPDDVGGPVKTSLFQRGGKLPRRARQNVVLELGYFWGLLGRKRVCALVSGDVERPSDLHGIVYIPRRDNWKLDLFRELRGAEMEFDQTKA